MVQIAVKAHPTRLREIFHITDARTARRAERGKTGREVNKGLPAAGLADAGVVSGHHNYQPIFGSSRPTYAGTCSSRAQAWRRQYLSDGSVPFDNNAAKNDLRSCARAQELPGCMPTEAIFSRTTGSVHFAI